MVSHSESIVNGNTSKLMRKMNRRLNVWLVKAVVSVLVATRWNAEKIISQ
jgi:hypothetical protein